MTGGSVTPQAVSGLLARAGYERSVAGPSRIRGLVENGPGFVACKYGTRPGMVQVLYRAGMMRGPIAAEREDRALTAYAATLTAAGYQVQRVDRGAFRVLLVTAGEG